MTAAARRKAAGIMRGRTRRRFAACCALALSAGCDIDGVTPICSEAGRCVTLPPESDASVLPSTDAESPDAARADAGDGADEGIAASP